MSLEQPMGSTLVVVLGLWLHHCGPRVFCPAMERKTRCCCCTVPITSEETIESVANWGLEQHDPWHVHVLKFLADAALIHAVNSFYLVSIGGAMGLCALHEDVLRALHPDASWGW
jgi:hypothetical protein